MAIGTDRYASRATAVCSSPAWIVIAAWSPRSMAQSARARVTAERAGAFPFFCSARRSSSPRRYRYDAVVAAARFLGLAATFLPSSAARTPTPQPARFECRLGSGYVRRDPDQPEPTNPLSFVVSAGKREGCAAVGVSAPRGSWVCRTVDEHTSVVLSWAHPNFAPAPSPRRQRRRHAAPHGRKAQRLVLELQGVLYRQQVRRGSDRQWDWARVPPASDRRGDRSAGEEKGWDARTGSAMIHPAELSQ